MTKLTIATWGAKYSPRIWRVCPTRTGHKVVRAHHGLKTASRHLDAFVLLHNGDPMDDDSTVSSHGLSRETIVGISNQDVAKGRERRRERAERARRESLAEREAKQKKVLAACATAFILVVYLTTG